MRRFTSAVAVLAALLLAMAAVAPGVAAQGDAMTMAGHPFVGSWIIDPTPGDASDARELLSAGPGGTVMSASAEGVGFGAWAPTGERSLELTFVFPAADPATGTVMGWVTIRAIGEVAKDGRTFAGTYTLEPPSAMAEAMGIPVGQLGPGEVTGQRIAVEPMGEPVGPIPPTPTAP